MRRTKANSLALVFSHSCLKKIKASPSPFSALPSCPLPYAGQLSCLRSPLPNSHTVPHRAPHASALQTLHLNGIHLPQKARAFSTFIRKREGCLPAVPALRVFLKKLIHILHQGPGLSLFHIYWVPTVCQAVSWVRGSPGEPADMVPQPSRGSRWVRRVGGGGKTQPGDSRHRWATVHAAGGRERVGEEMLKRSRVPPWTA